MNQNIVHQKNNNGHNNEQMEASVVVETGIMWIISSVFFAVVFLFLVLAGGVVGCHFLASDLVLGAFQFIGVLVGVTSLIIHGVVGFSLYLRGRRKLAVVVEPVNSLTEIVLFDDHAWMDESEEKKSIAECLQIVFSNVLNRVNESKEKMFIGEFFNIVASSIQSKVDEKQYVRDEMSKVYSNLATKIDCLLRTAPNVSVVAARVVKSQKRVAAVRKILRADLQRYDRRLGYTKSSSLSGELKKRKLIFTEPLKRDLISLVGRRSVKKLGRKSKSKSSPVLWTEKEICDMKHFIDRTKGNRAKEKKRETVKMALLRVQRSLGKKKFRKNCRKQSSEYRKRVESSSWYKTADNVSNKRLCKRITSFVQREHTEKVANLTKTEGMLAAVKKGMKSLEEGTLRWKKFVFVKKKCIESKSKDQSDIKDIGTVFTALNCRKECKKHYFKCQLLLLGMESFVTLKNVIENQKTEEDEKEVDNLLMKTVRQFCQVIREERSLVEALSRSSRNRYVERKVSFSLNGDKVYDVSKFSSAKRSSKYFYW